MNEKIIDVFKKSISMKNDYELENEFFKLSSLNDTTEEMQTYIGLIEYEIQNRTSKKGK